jgi:hypothetical protein
MTKHRRVRRVLLCEQLEPRCLLSGFQFVDPGDFHAVIVAGDPKGKPADSPAQRIDANTTTSPFAGVGSLRISASSGTYICTATPIDPTHVLTAGHCVDINNNGQPDVTGITFNLNDGGDLTSQIPASDWVAHPNFTGFNSPSINDDLAVITLATPLPPGVPTYPLATSDMVSGSTHLYMVGYGRSGDGVKGYTTGASFTIKRDGENMVDAFYGQDDQGQPAANEVFRFDFDGPKANTNTWGGRTLGNDKETTLGGGDSGGPSFVLVGADLSSAASYQLAGINTFTQGFNAPKFGSLGGGINVYPYTGWIDLVRSGLGGTSSGGGSGASGTSTVASAPIIVLGTSEDSPFSLSSRGFTLASSTAEMSSPTWSGHVAPVLAAIPVSIEFAATSSNESVECVLASIAGKHRIETAHDDWSTAVDKVFHSKAVDGIFEESILVAED